jgi:alpha-amylase/alpha-mannosidase (GH57 family)
MIAPYPRYAALHARRREPDTFSPEDLRDLQVWHKLAWMDPDWLRRDRRLARLVEQGSAFTEADKAALRQVELELLGRVVPAYRAAAARGQVELSTSPFYHPILPLLCDSDIHQVAHPGAPRPRRRFQWPGDAREQIQRALTFHERTFGAPARGLWPSEGAVSDAVLGMASEAGLAWTASDEDVLARSLATPLPRDAEGHAGRPDLLYRPYRVGAGKLAVLFRDHALADRIGFQYQSWEASRAADDFIVRVREAGARFRAATGGDTAVVTVILDGENAWEHYAGGGRPFLRALYGGLTAAPDIECVTMSQAAADPRRPLDAIFPGSWIDADFGIWIGHRDDQRAWSQLADVRAAFDAHERTLKPDARAAALDELLIAEGSDWFWWYGEDHSSDHDRDFDELFRRHVRNAYAAMGLTPPAELSVTNISTGPPVESDELTFGGGIDPVLDGRDTSALEWAGAARPPSERVAGVMHEVSSRRPRVADVRLGVGRDSLFVRLDGPGLADAVRSGARSIGVVISAPEPVLVRVAPDAVAADRLVEARVPFAALGVGPGARVQLVIQLHDRAGQAVESVPRDGSPWSIRLGETPGSWGV